MYRSYTRNKKVNKNKREWYVKGIEQVTQQDLPQFWIFAIAVNDWNDCSLSADDQY